VASRVSAISGFALMLIDAYVIMLHVLAGLMVSGAAHAFVLLAFVQLITFSFFQVRYALRIWRANPPQFWINICSRLYMYVATLILFLIFVNFPSVWGLFIFVFYGFWVPQIVENIRKNSNQNVDWLYLALGSAARLAPLWYFTFAAENFLQVAPKPLLGLVVTGFVMAQLGVLGLQDRYGGRFLVPFVFHTYNYKPGRDPIGDVSDENCVICMTDITAEDVRLGRYMVAPCLHWFHEECLLGWMKEKLHCPVCRAPLPT
jgi:hypothetical protein